MVAPLLGCRHDTARRPPRRRLHVGIALIVLGVLVLAYRQW
ncbi:hypothetical protein ACFQL4_06490 [Halosimplex aquaticum]